MPSGIIQSQSIFATAFTAQAISTGGPWDVFGILSGANDKLAVHAINLAILSSAAISGSVGVQVFRGSTASSTSGSASVANIRAGQPNAITDPSSVTLPSFVSSQHGISITAL